MNKYKPLYSVKTNSDGKKVAVFDKPFVFHCNCPGIVTNVMALINDSGVGSMPVVALSSSKVLKDYVTTLGVYEHYTSIIKKYGVIVNPLTSEMLNIGGIYKKIYKDKTLSNEQRQEKRNELLQNIRDIYNGN